MCSSRQQMRLMMINPHSRQRVWGRCQSPRHAPPLPPSHDVYGTYPKRRREHGIIISGSSHQRVTAIGDEALTDNP